MVAEAETRRSPTLVQLREWLTLIGAVVVVLGGLLGGVRLVVAPLHTEMQAITGRLDRMAAEIRAGREETTALRENMQNEFKAVRTDIAVLSERLTRMETRIEQRDRVKP